MPTLNATVYPSMDYVLVEVDWTDQPTVTHARVVRRNTVTGEEVTLRPYGSYDADGNMLLNCGQGIWWDTEAPLNVALEYCTYAAAVQTNLLVNGTFETGTAPWVPTGGTLTQSAVFAHSGTFSGLITPPGTDVIAAARDFTGYALPANTEVTMQAWILSPQGWNAAYIQAEVVGPASYVTYVETPMYTLYPSQWQLLRITFTTGTTASTLSNLYVGARGLPPNTVLFYIDDVSVSYAQDLGLSACETVTVTSENMWLRNPLNPCLDVLVGTCSPAMDFDCEEDSRISYAGHASDNRDANTVLSEPVNRIYPIPVSRARRAPRSELALIAHDCDARDEIIATNQPGTPLLFQPLQEYCLGDRYMSVGTVTEARFSIDQREEFRLMQLPYAVVRRPAGPANGICGSRISDLCDLYTSWQSMTLAGLDWDELILGLASADGPGSGLPAGFRIWSEVVTEFADWTAVAGGGSRDWNELRDGL